MILEIKNRLHDLSYIMTAQDNFLVEYLYQKVRKEVTNDIGQSSTASELDAFLIDRVCGLFLQQRYLEGKLNNFSDEQAIASIKEGDLSISFRERKDKVVALCDYLINKDFDLSPYRSIIW